MQSGHVQRAPTGSRFHYRPPRSGADRVGRNRRTRRRKCFLKAAQAASPTPRTPLGCRACRVCLPNKTFLFMGTAEVVTRLLDYWSRKYGMVQGSRNGNLLILAQWMNEHGVPLADALAACLPMEDRSGSDPFTAAEIRQVVVSAYRRTVAGSKPWITGTRQRTPPPPQAHPYRYTGASISPTDRAALERMAARNPAVNTLVTLLDLDIVNSRVRFTNGGKQG
jgi:hypothetical protein